MKGKLKKIEVREFENKDKKKFKKVCFEVDVVTDEERGYINTLRGSYSVEFAKKYFEYCGVKTKDLIGKEVGVILAKRKYENAEGEERTTTFIKFLNVLDENGEAILMPKDDAVELDF